MRWARPRPDTAGHAGPAPRGCRRCSVTSTIGPGRPAPVRRNRRGRPLAAAGRESDRRPRCGRLASRALARIRRRTLAEVVVRADSGFYAHKVVEACRRYDARFSISVRLQESHHQLIAAIPEDQWRPIPYWKEGAASVAEIPYAPFGKKQTYRMIVRRLEALADVQQVLPGVGHLHFTFITDREGDMLELEADRRQRLAGPERDRVRPGRARWRGRGPRCRKDANTDIVRGMAEERRCQQLVSLR
jgi:hypothetical protein